MITGDVFGDFFEFDPMTSVWTVLSSDSVPSARFGHGFITIGKKLFVLAGYTGAGLFLF